MTQIVYVDENDKIIGGGTREDAWHKGIINRIARVFLFNSGGELLIQKRANHLSSMPGEWDSSAAGHVDVGEEYAVAARRELLEEVGVTNVELLEKTKLFTDETDESDKIKKRFNMLYVATYDGEITPNVDEVSEVRWIGTVELNRWMTERPQDFTAGFLLTFRHLQNIFPEDFT